MKKNNRDNFTTDIINILAQRVNYLCSNPECRRGTSGPRSDGRALKTGVAAHICAAAPGGPRYDNTMTSEERCSQENGIWLCQTCSKLIDSDINKYTVEILKLWKREAEEWASKALINLPESTVLNENNNISINNDLIKENQLININDKKEYNGVSKEFLNSFDSLKDYLYCRYYSKSYEEFFKKDFNVKDKKLSFCIDLMDWIMGTKKFPINRLKDFYINCDTNLLSCNLDILKMRWEALYYFFNGNLNRSKEIYLKIKREKEFKKIDEWIKDDILIDGRNILIRIENNSFKFLENVFQLEIEKSNHNINYPSADRLKCDLYENVIKHIFDYQNKSKYTQIYGVGLQYILNSVQDLIYITITYGSITHLLLIRKIIAEIMSVYANCYGDELFYKLTLREKILNADFKDYKKIYEKIKLTYRFVESKEFIDEILNLEKSLLKYNLNEYYTFIFDVYGRYLDDVIFEKYENKILNIICGRKRSYIISSALKTIPSNIDRFRNKEKLFNILLKFICSKHRKYFNEIETIISNTKFSELTKNEQDIFITLVEQCYLTKEIDIIEPAIEIKNSRKIKTFDDILLKKDTTGNLFYNLSKNKSIDSLQYIIKELTRRAEERENNPSTHHGYGVNYTIGSDFFESKKNNKEIFNIINNDIFPLACLILHSKNQYAIEKIKMLKTLAYIYLKDTNYKKTIMDITNEIEFECPNMDFAIYKSKNNIKVYIILFEYLNQKITLFDLVSRYLFMAIEESELLIDISDALIIINKYKVISNKKCINIVYSIYSLGINSEDLDIRKSSIKISYIFINTEYFDIIQNNLLGLLKASNFAESVAIGNMLYSLKISKRKLFKSVVDEMRTSRNFNTRYIANKYFRNL